MIVDEAVRGRVPPSWFWALPGIDRIRAFDLSQLPSPPIARLLGIRAGHVGPGSGTWVMPATGWSVTASGELEISMLAEAAVTGVAMTTLTPGLDTGECERQGRALAGMAVHVAARIQGRAGAGDILVSSTVKDIVVGSDTRFKDRGPHSLRGTPGEWRLFSLLD